jgi:hypothetical protein
MWPDRRLGIRWTVGDVLPRGFEALRLSILGMQRLLGDACEYAVCVNGVSIERVWSLVSPLPLRVRWCEARRDMLPGWFRRFTDDGMSGGPAWKFAPLRLFPDRFELSLDNDVVMWALPESVVRWLREANPKRALIAEDVAPLFGQFAPKCGDAPRNSGIRGLPPGFDLEGALQSTLEESADSPLSNEGDEQGLQVAALSRLAEPAVVKLEEVTVCSPFPPHVPDLGRCGAHFVGLNTSLPFMYYDRTADAVRAEHWDELAPEIERRLLSIDPARSAFR